MAATLKFELVSPERVLFSEDVEHVVLPAIEGDMGVLPEHAPIVSTLRPGIITILGGSKPRRIFVRDGFAEFTPNTLNVLAEQAIDVDTGDSEAISSALAAAEKDLAEAQDDAKRFMANSAIDALKSI